MTMPAAASCLIRLWELSEVAAPANPLAQITSVKSLAQAEQFILGLRKAADAEALAHLQAIHSHALSLLSDIGAEEQDEDDDEEDEEDNELALVLAELKELALQKQALVNA